jgi:amino acid permease
MAVTQSKEIKLVSTSRTIFNMAKAAVGLGAILLVAVMQTLGLGYGLIALGFCAVLSALTLHFLARVTVATRAHSYFAACGIILGGKGELVALVSLTFVLFGSLMGYTFFIGEYASSGLFHLTGLSIYPKLLSIIVLGLLVFPISCMKDMGKLSVVSIFGMIIMCSITLLMVVNFFTAQPIFDSIKAHFPPDSINPEYLTGFKTSVPIFPPLSFAALGCFGSIAFAYTNHFALVSAVNSLDKSSPKRIAIVILVSTVITAIINIVIGIFSLLYYKNTKVLNILDIPVMNRLFAFAKIGVAISLSFTYPLLLDPLRNVLDRFFKRFSPDSAVLRHYSETIFIIIVPLVIVLIFDQKVSNILDVVSSLFRVLLVYVLPPLMLLRGPKAIPLMSLKTWERYCAYFILAFGVIVCIFGPIFPFLKLIGRAPQNSRLISFRKPIV